MFSRNYGIKEIPREHFKSKEVTILSNTKIIVLSKKELIYTGLLLGLILFFLLLMFLMFHGTKHEEKQKAAKYTPGVYSCQIELNKTPLNLEIAVDENHVNSVTFRNLNESVSAMYPLLDSTLKDIEKQLQNNVPVSEISGESENKYTQGMLLDSISNLLEQAKSE